MRIYQGSQLFSVQILSTQLLQNFLGKKISTPLPRYIALLCVCVASKETSRKKLPRKLNANLVAWFLVFPASVSKLKAIAYHNCELVNDSRVKFFCCEELLWNGILYKIERWLCPRIKIISNQYFQNLFVIWGNGERSKTFGTQISTSSTL